MSRAKEEVERSGDDGPTSVESEGELALLCQDRKGWYERCYEGEEEVASSR